MFTRTGYTQVGWATVDGGEKVYGFEDVYTKNAALTLYPVWNTNKYTITFDTQRRQRDRTDYTGLRHGYYRSCRPDKRRIYLYRMG